MMSAAFAGAWSILDPRAQVSPPMLWWARGISRRKLLILLYFDLLVVACVNRWPTLLERRCGCHPSDWKSASWSSWERCATTMST